MIEAADLKESLRTDGLILNSRGSEQEVTLAETALVHVPSVSVSSTTSHGGDIHDDSDISVQEQDDDDESYVYESDYEYHDEASDDDVRVGKAEEGAAQVADTTSAGIKRRNLSPTSLTLKNTPSKNSRRNGNAKTTGLDEEEEEEDEHLALSIPDFLQNPAWTPHVHDTGGEHFCAMCQREDHTPVMDCDMLASWLELIQDQASGILSVPSSCVSACMVRRMQEPPPAPPPPRETEQALRRAYYQRRQRQRRMGNPFPTREELDLDDCATPREAYALFSRYSGNYHPPRAPAVDDRSTLHTGTTSHAAGTGNSTEDGKTVASNGTEAATSEDGAGGVASGAAASSPASRDEHMKIVREEATGTTATDNDADGAAATNSNQTENATLHIHVGDEVAPAATDGASDERGDAAERIQSTQDCDEVSATANTQSISSALLQEPIHEDDSWTCPICTDDDVDEIDKLSLGCDHTYCRDCWSRFFLTMLEDARQTGGLLNRTSSCPDQQCNQRITREHVGAMAPNLVQLYDELALNTFVQTNQETMRWCPGPNCGNIFVHSREGLFLHHTGEQPGSANCEACGGRYCFRCGEAAHYPQQCSVDLFDGEAENLSANAGNVLDMMPIGLGGVARLPDTDQDNGLLAGAPAGETKKTGKSIRLCPRCKTPIEKNGGCNHMTCKCGHHFCWLCMADMNHLIAGHFCGREPGLGALHGGRFSYAMPRNRIDLDYLEETVTLPNSNCTEADVNYIHMRQQELQRYVHYYDRYMAHHEGQVFAENHCQCVAERAVDFARASSMQNGAEADFFQLANQRLVASRRMLKYSYCYLYYKLVPSNAGGDASMPQGFEDSDCPVDSATSPTLSTSLAFFLDHQERLERVTERLSFLSENAVTRTDRQRVVEMINTLDRCMQAVAATSLEELEAKANH